MWYVEISIKNTGYGSTQDTLIAHDDDNLNRSLFTSQDRR
jgi:hypothetical protein